MTNVPFVIKKYDMCLKKLKNLLFFAQSKSAKSLTLFNIIYIIIANNCYFSPNRSAPVCVAVRQHNNVKRAPDGNNFLKKYQYFGG